MVSMPRLVVEGSIADVQAVLHAALTPEEFALVRLEANKSTGSTFRTPPVGEQSLIEVVITFAAQAAASGIVWDVMKKIVVAVGSHFADNDHNKDDDDEWDQN